MNLDAAISLVRALDQQRLARYFLRGGDDHEVEVDLRNLTRQNLTEVLVVVGDTAPDALARVDDQGWLRVV
jgi:hypothetical protein